MGIDDFGAAGGPHALKAPPTSSQLGACAQTVEPAPNTKYTLRGWAQGSYACLGVRGGVTGSAWTSAGDWSKLTVPFTTDASGTATVCLHGWYGQGTVCGDDFTLS
ncbi:hypothetical protein [Streptomyces sp. NBC_00388]|uniref:hypothetical protein n=1 Tax=Streptomyces sp. NBC_00388 TaxID=2975735 RepID=UPI002E1C437F